MNDAKNPHKPDSDMSPAQQTGEEFGNVGDSQRKGNSQPERWDTSRGSEPEQRGTSGRRG